MTVTADQLLVAPGKKLTGKIDGLIADTPVTVALVAQHTKAHKPDDLPCTTNITGEAGTFECSVPASHAEGTYKVVLHQTGPGSKEREATSQDVYVLLADKYDPQITGPTLPIAPGSNTALKGSGYRPGGTVTVKTSNSFYVPGGWADIDENGNFGVTLRTSWFTPEGQYQITVTDDITGVERQLSIYVLRSNATLSVSVNTGVEGGFPTEVSGEGFAQGQYGVDLKLYAADGATLLAPLAADVKVADTVLKKTTVAIPADTKPGLYQVAAVAPDARLAATWIAVFPAQQITTPPAQGGGTVPPPVMTAPVVVPPAVTPPVQEPQLPFLHQSGSTTASDPFGLANTSNRQAPDLNATNPSLKPTGNGSVSKDPTPLAQSSTPSTPEPKADSAPLVRVETTQDIWPLILVAVIAIAVGLAAGYLIARSQRHRAA